MRISDWSSDVCSSDLSTIVPSIHGATRAHRPARMNEAMVSSSGTRRLATSRHASRAVSWREAMGRMLRLIAVPFRVELCGASLRQDSFLVLPPLRLLRSEEHTSELQSLMRTSYAVFCLKKKKK